MRERQGGRGQHRRKLIGAGISFAVLGIALWFLHRELQSLTAATIVAQIRSIPFAQLLAAAGLAAGSYLVLTCYDNLAARHLGHKISYKRAALTSFLAYAIGNNVGIAALSGGSVRYRMYSLLGFGAGEIAGIVVFCALTFALGASMLAGLALLLMPDALDVLATAPVALVRGIGALLVMLPVAYVALTHVRRAGVRVGNWVLQIPRPATAWMQLGLSVAEATFAASSLYVLLADDIQIGLLGFLGIYVVAMAAGLISSVPGGIGVFEAVLLAALPSVDRGLLLGTIIVYRLIYYIAPLLLAMLLLAGYEIKEHQAILQRSAEQAGSWLSSIVPQAIGASVFLAGLVLLISGALPAVESRLGIVAAVVPLPVMEISHLGGSVLAVGLLVLARGLYRRLRAAYSASLAVLACGILVSLLKGLEYEEATVLAVVAVLVFAARDEFYRRGKVAMQRFTPGWLLSIALAFGAALWVGLISYRDVEYSSELWWQFALSADAPRWLRASVLAAVAMGGFALWKVMSAGRLPSMPASTDQDWLRAALANARSTSSNLALLGDKRFLWSQDRRAFVMYQVSGNSWIAMGGPVGDPAATAEVAWAFRELVDRHDGRPVFYEVSDESLPLFVDMGLTLAKLGEEARVPLANFSLQGAPRAELRHACSRAKRDGASFEIVPRAAVPAIAAQLRRVSDSWLEDKGAAEKAFSLGAFSESYIANFDCAVVRQQGAIVAFGNLWTAPSGKELALDLMRYDEHAPKGVMDFLFAQTMLWGAAQDFEWFSLGMAPLSGLEQRALAPLWHKLGHAIFTHGESFYNFEDLRRYKEKFEPQWQPRYVACPGGWFGLPNALVDASRLISGGWTPLAAAMP